MYSGLCSWVQEPKPERCKGGQRAPWRKTAKGPQLQRMLLVCDERIFFTGSIWSAAERIRLGARTPSGAGW